MKSWNLDFNYRIVSYPSSFPPEVFSLWPGQPGHFRRLNWIANWSSHRSISLLLNFPFQRIFHYQINSLSERFHQNAKKIYDINLENVIGRGKCNNVVRWTELTGNGSRSRMELHRSSRAQPDHSSVIQMLNTFAIVANRFFVGSTLVVVWVIKFFVTNWNLYQYLFCYLQLLFISSLQQ